MLAHSRPFRFIALIIGAWVGARTIMVWPRAPGAVPGSERGVQMAAALAPRPGYAPSFATTTIVADVPPVSTKVNMLAAAHGSHISVAPAAQRSVIAGDRPAAAAVPIVATGAEREARSQVVSSTGTIVPPPGATPAIGRGAQSRWSGNAFVFVRNGGAASPTTPLLGGAQAAFKVAYALGAERRVALAARVSAPLARGAIEYAAGAEWQPLDVPVRLVAEARLRGTTLRPAIGIFGGFGDVPIAARFRLDGYGQAGVIARSGGYAEAQLRLARPVAVGGAVDLGLGGWGSIQRGASRIDIGPSIGLRLPVAQGARMTFDWRGRVAGNARPRAGPVLTLGAGF